MSKPRPIKCEKCEAAGVAYTMRHGGWMPVTDMYFPPFLDDDGRRHSHDGNSGGGEYWVCSNGHTVYVDDEREKCWCGWPIRGPFVPNNSGETKA